MPSAQREKRHAAQNVRVRLVSNARRTAAALASAVALFCAAAVLAEAAVPTIAYDNLTVLMGADASMHGNVKKIDMGPGKIGWVQSWSSPDDFLSWTTNVAKAGDYQIRMIAQGADNECVGEVQVAGQSLKTSCEGKWDRFSFGVIRVPAGVQTITFRSIGKELIRKFFSLEFVEPNAQKKLEAAGAKQGADTSALVAGKYGLLFHWTSQTMPRSGSPKSYCQAVADFDVQRFADTIAQMGAGHVVFTTSHAGYYFPGPNKVIDSVLPGRTCTRDLVGDLADALAKHDVRLWLYYHPGHDDVPWWSKTHFDDDKGTFFDLWCKVIAEIGERYGRRIAGFWFDDATFTYYPFNPPWQRMTAAAKAGNPNRLVTYNSWILPKVNDFYEVFAGENAFSEEVINGDGYLPVGGTGKFTGGPQKGLQGHITTFLEGNWGHFKRDTPIGPPRYTADVMVAKLKDAINRKNVPTFDIEIYQDGTISPQTFELFQSIKQSIKPQKQ